MFHLGIGPEYVDRGGTSGSQTMISYDAGANWQATEKFSFFITGNNGVQVSAFYAANAVKFYVLSAGAVYLFTPGLTFTLSGSYRADNYLDPQLLADHTTGYQEDKGTGVNARLTYQTPAQFLLVYGEANYQKTDSNVWPYNEARVSVGATLKY